MIAKNVVAYLPEVVRMANYLISRQRTDNQIIAMINGEFPYQQATPLELFSLIHSLRVKQSLTWD